MEEGRINFRENEIKKFDTSKFVLLRHCFVCSRSVGLVGHVARTKEMIPARKIFIRKSDETLPHWRP
jgi:citrate synthase